jgi:hypothetical protein
MIPLFPLKITFSFHSFHLGILPSEHRTGM